MAYKGIIQSPSFMKSTPRKPKSLARNLEMCRFQAFYLKFDLCKVATLLRDTMYLLEM